MIGYLIQQELGNELPLEKRLASLLTLIEVDPDDPAFGDPTKPIGPIYTEEEVDELAEEKGWTFKPDGDSFRRVVPSPLPQADLRHRAGRAGCSSTTAVVICAGGGGIPVMYTDEAVPAGQAARRRRGRDRQGPRERAAREGPEGRRARDRDRRRRRLRGLGHAGAARDPPRDARRRSTGTEFAAGSMGPKVRAACSFVEETGGLAAIGSIEDTPALLRGEAGTIVTREADGLEVGE